MRVLPYEEMLFDDVRKLVALKLSSFGTPPAVPAVAMLTSLLPVAFPTLSGTLYCSIPQSGHCECSRAGRPSETAINSDCMPSSEGIIAPSEEVGHG